MTKLNKRKCLHCKKEFQKKKPLDSVCGIICALGRAKYLREIKDAKNAQKAHRTMKEGLLTHKDYLKLAQTVFNAFIRKRDENEPCISCGATNVEEFHAGHYVASTYQILRFNEDNVHKQCSRCNTHLRGNLISYREGLIYKIGLEEVEKLEAERHKTFKMSIPELKEMILLYKKKIKEL